MAVRIFITKLCEEIKKRKFFMSSVRGMTALAFHAYPEAFVTRSPIGLFSIKQAVVEGAHIKHMFMQKIETKNGVAAVTAPIQEVQLDLEEVEALEEALEGVGSKRVKRRKGE